MTCTVCGQRAGRRSCPALKSAICPVCCATKREIEIHCPSDCQYLVSGRAHPAAVVRRQQENDFKAFLPTVRDLDERQSQLMWRLLAAIRDHRGDALLKITDADVEAAAQALASTHETAARGLIYEQRAGSLPAQRLSSELVAVIAQLGIEQTSSLDRDLAAVFRAIERGARDARKTLPGGDTAYLELLRRIIVPTTPKSAEAPPGGLVDPGAGSSLLIRP